MAVSLASARPPIVLATAEKLKLGDALEKRSPEVVHIGSDPCEASAAVATRFWSILAKSSSRLPMIPRR